MRAYQALLICGWMAGCSLAPLENPEENLETMAASGVRSFRSTYQMNSQPYPTELSASDLINVFVPAAEVALFGQLDPGRSGSGVIVPEGFLVVREVISAGQISKLTVMVKGPPGYFPGGGDFFYGVTSPDGNTFIPDENGVVQEGPIAACGECHARRAQDGFLFGVPTNLHR